ncbi:hypothetical protein R3W88_031889 [Solanum pinnatisectum]|uniref:F-box/LRR-repeat protein 15/At3g58940/PEG3-like LRR domain-containing protein n=1 Tax=Solanum pinnatisectum TaxID=50273 RepID=A0AAV9LRH5_9SOLN|nr:hypothetical protein R3W88_031889 [Solanum pinnatisectum]
MPLENYVKLVDQSLRSHVEQNLHLEQFILTYYDPELDSHLDTWIELVVKLNITELGSQPSVLRPNSLPDFIYDAKKFKTLSTTHIRFCCLESLSLNHVHISDAQLQRVIDKCLSIKTLSLKYCEGISKCHIFGLVHLEYLTADNILPCKIAILDGYNTLQTLILFGAIITDQQFQNIFRKFPNISELELGRCYKLKNIEIRSEKFKKFTLLLRLNSLEKLTIQAPNLLEFDFHSSKMSFSYMGMDMETSSLERVISTLKGCIQKENCGKECPFNIKWHRNLKEVISCTGTSKEGMAASRWYLWLKSTFVIHRVNSFVLKWKDEA